MKTFVLLALLALAASVAFAQNGEEIYSEGGDYGRCTEEQLQQQTMMYACRDYLKQQCMASPTMPVNWATTKWRMSSCQALRQRCCQQLGQMAPQCRCEAIRRTFREVQGELGGFVDGEEHIQRTKVMQMARTLPSMCNMYPSYCNIPSSGGCY